MAEEATIEQDNLDSLKRVLENDSNMQLFKDYKKSQILLSKAVMDEIAERLFFSLIEDYEEEVLKYKSEIQKFEKVFEDYHIKLNRYKAVLHEYCVTAKTWHEAKNYTGFLEQRNVGIQYPPKIIFSNKALS